MAASAYSLSRIHLPFPSFYPEFRKPNISSKFISFPLISLSSISSHNSFIGTFTLYLSSISTKRRHVSATVSFSPPTANPERVTGDKIPKWSRRAIKSFAIGELEARKLKYPTTGTEALLMGILIEGDDGEITTADLLLGIWSEMESPGRKILASLGFDNEKAEKLKSLGSKLGFTEE